MKKGILSLSLALAAVVGWSSAALCVPTLQLDISDSYYDTSTETVVSTTDPFTLYALLTPNGDDNSGKFTEQELLSSWYYISVAIAPKQENQGDIDLGSFSINGDTYLATEDMMYGVPPVESVAMLQPRDPGDLAKHDMFETYYIEEKFRFDANNNVETYNTQDSPGGIDLSTDGGTYYVSFDIDTTLLNPLYFLHFDLYKTNADGTPTLLMGSTDIDIDLFAPFSHDAESGPVPEPATMLLFGAGLVGIGSFGRRKVKTKKGK